jgi:hypothetical protein
MSVYFKITVDGVANMSNTKTLILFLTNFFGFQGLLSIDVSTVRLSWLSYS